MGYDLAVSRPSQLVRVRGQWVLEVERMAHVGGRLYRPRRSFVRGRESILRELERACVPSLCEAATELLGSESAEGATFRIVDGAFERIERARGEGAMDERLVALDEGMKRMQEELAVLRLRVRQLELRESASRPRGGAPGALREPAAASGGAAGAAAPRRGADAPGGRAAGAASAEARGPRRDAGADPRAEAAAGGGAGDAARAGGPGAADEAVGARGPDPDAAAAGEGDPSADARAFADAAEEGASAPPHAPAPDAPPAEAPGPPRLAFPGAEAYGEMLGSLLGEEIAMREAAPEDRPPIEPPMLVTELLADDDEPVGALVVDLAAAVEHGGTLLMLGPEARREELDSGLVSEDVMEGMAEVLNVLSRSFNDIPGNPHVRVGTLSAVDDDTPAWLRDPPHRLDLLCDRGGRTILVSR